MTRSAVVVSPHPLARECSADAARTLAAAAVAAGAPDGVIQVVDEPSVPLINALMADERTSVIVATGGGDVVRAAYSSGNPAIGVGPGNVPVLVDGTADLASGGQADRGQQELRQLDPVHQRVGADRHRGGRAGTLLRHLKREGCYLLEPGRAGQGPRPGVPRRPLRHPVRRPGRDLDRRAGRHPGAGHDPGAAGAVPAGRRRRSRWRTRSCARCSAWSRCPARAGHRRGAGRAADRRPRAIRPRSTAPTRRRSWRTGRRWTCSGSSVNAGSSLGSSGLETGLAPSMTIGTGFFGRSSVGENLQPKHFVQWTRLAYNSDPAEAFGDFAGLDPWDAPVGAVPPYPLASNLAEHGERRQRQATWTRRTERRVQALTLPPRPGPGGEPGRPGPTPELSGDPAGRAGGAAGASRG